MTYGLTGLYKCISCGASCCTAPGQYWTSTACLPCISNCNICSTSTNCIVCNSGYLLDATGTCVQAGVCILPCITCTLTNCLVCNTGFNLNTSTGLCECMPGQYNNGGTSCSSCSIIPNCL